MAAAKKKKKSRLWLYIFLIFIGLGIIVLLKTFGPNTGKFTNGDYLYIHTGWRYEQVKTALEQGGFVSDMTSFDFLASRAKLPAHIHPGKYKFNEAMSNYSIIRMLRGGHQTPVKLVINKLRTLHDFITMVSTNLEADSLALNQLLHNPTYLSQFSLDTNTVMCAVVPATYSFKWNTNAKSAFKKIADNYEHFWTDDRKAEAKSKGLTQTQATTLASIIDEETNINEDKPKIASVYLNRLQKGMKLQADPTVKFAVNDFTIRRISGDMLQNQSPYNTYVHTGLPPGPICTPAATSIDAVLQAPKTTYLYFCAKEDFSGYSNFASTYEEQLRNARAYQQALNDKNIH
jgi:UPF0755 protein